MLKYALLFALAALVVGLSAPSLFPESARPLDGSASARGSAPAAPARQAESQAVAREGSGFREASIAADAGGQFRASAFIEGQPVDMMVDTGATVIAISAETAARLGVVADPAAPKWRMHTANGVTFASPVVLSRVNLGSIEMNDVQAVVMPSGATSMDLLGASFLKRLASVEQRDGMLLLRQ
jgi:aspartyl protease family protein